MKKIFVLAVLLVVIGVLCAVFFMRGNDGDETTDERPWTVGEETESATQAQTTEPVEIDAVGAYSDLVHLTLRDSFTFLSKEESYAAAELGDALLGVYIYDIDTDGAEETVIVRAVSDGIFADVYEFRGGKAQYAASQKLTLDPMGDVSLSLSDSSLRHIEARLTIYPVGGDRFLCLTAEQQGADGEYNAYTVVMEYAKEKLTVKKSYRLRQNLDVITFLCTDSVSLLYRHAPGDAADADTQVTLAKYDSLTEAFKAEFGKLGLTAPQVTVENGALTQYKVMPVASEQKVFDVTVDAGKVQIGENGFLQSFVLRK